MSSSTSASPATSFRKPSHSPRAAPVPRCWTPGSSTLAQERKSFAPGSCHSVLQLQTQSHGVTLPAASTSSTNMSHRATSTTTVAKKGNFWGTLSLPSACPHLTPHAFQARPCRHRPRPQRQAQPSLPAWPSLRLLSPQWQVQPSLPA